MVTSTSTSTFKLITIRNCQQVVLTVCEFLAIFEKSVKMTQYLILLKQGANIISYNSKQRSNVSRTFLLKKIVQYRAGVKFSEQSLPTIQTRNFYSFFFFFNFRIETWLRKTPANSFPTKLACLLTFQLMFNTRYLTLATTFSVLWVLFWLFCHLSVIRLLS